MKNKNFSIVPNLNIHGNLVQFSQAGDILVGCPRVNQYVKDSINNGKMSQSYLKWLQNNYPKSASTLLAKYDEDKTQLIEIDKAARVECMNAYKLARTLGQKIKSWKDIKNWLWTNKDKIYKGILIVVSLSSILSLARGLSKPVVNNVTHTTTITRYG